jgi:hypothetical protein
MSAFSQCGKFVIDDNAGTIRLPKVVNIQGLTDLSKLGEIVEAGLPNIAGTFTTLELGYHGHEATSGALYSFSGNTGGVPHGGGGTSAGLGIDASRSSSIYGNSNTVQQEQIQYPYFIQVATGAETEDNITNIIELNNPFSFGDSKYSPKPLNNLSWLKSEGQWNSKAVYPSYYDWTLTNFNNGVEGFALSTGEYTDYDIVINPAEETFRLPLLDGSENLLSSKYDELQILASGASYTAPANGFFCARGSVAGSYVSIYNQSTWIANCGDFKQSIDTGHATCPVKKGDIVNLAYNSMPLNFRFVYAQGNGSLYFYVGETVQNANLINAGRIEEKLVEKLDRSSVKAYIVETYVNGNSWYRVWSDGWKEQGGIVNNGSATWSWVRTVNLLKSFSNINYTIVVTAFLEGGSGAISNLGAFNTKMKNQFQVVHNSKYAGDAYCQYIDWYACGY